MNWKGNKTFSRSFVLHLEMFEFCICSQFIILRVPCFKILHHSDTFYSSYMETKHEMPFQGMLLLRHALLGALSKS